MSQPGQSASPGQGDNKDATPRVTGGNSDQAANEAPPAPQARSVQPVASPEVTDEVVELENKLAEARARAAGDNTVNLKVEGSHSGLIHNGVYVGTDWTAVPAHAVAAMLEAAENSGVTLTQEG